MSDDCLQTSINIKLLNLDEIKRNPVGMNFFSTHCIINMCPGIQNLYLTTKFDNFDFNGELFQELVIKSLYSQVLSDLLAVKFQLFFFSIQNTLATCYMLQL